MSCSSAGAAHQAVLEEARELAVAEGHVRAALRERGEHVAERAQALVDRRAFRQRSALGPCLALPLTPCGTLPNQGPQVAHSLVRRLFCAYERRAACRLLAD